MAILLVRLFAKKCTFRGVGAMRSFYSTPAHVTWHCGKCTVISLVDVLKPEKPVPKPVFSPRNFCHVVL